MKMSKAEKIQQLINWLNQSNDQVTMMRIPKGWKSAVETMSENKIFFKAKHEQGLIYTFTKI